MRKKIVVRMLCLAMAASMIGTMVPTSLYPVTAKAAEANQDMEASDQNEDQIAVQAELEDGVNDEWTLENKVGDDAVCAVEDEWLHLKSGVGNGNDPGSKPAMFVKPHLIFPKMDILILQSKQTQRKLQTTVLVYILDTIPILLV